VRREVYLLGFIAAAAIARYSARRGADRSPVRTLSLFALASAVIYTIGTTWLSLDTGMSVSAGISAGVTPFLPGDALKAVLAAGLLPGTWRLLRRSTDSVTGPLKPPADRSE
jgi:biotin transport system substrate-specific component